MRMTINVTVVKDDYWDDDKQLEEIEIETEGPDAMHDLVDGVCAGLPRIIHDVITRREQVEPEDDDEQLG